MEIPIQQNNVLTEYYLEGIRILHNKYYRRNEQRGRNEWNDDKDHFLEPFMPGVCCLLDDIDENYIEHQGEEGGSIYEIRFNHKTFFIASADVTIWRSSYGKRGDISIRGLFSPKDNLKVYGDMETKVLIDRVLELLDEFLFKLQNDDMLSFQLLNKRSRRKTP